MFAYVECQHILYKNGHRIFKKVYVYKKYMHVLGKGSRFIDFPKYIHTHVNIYVHVLLEKCATLKVVRKQKTQIKIT